jgi:hypothetical protein
LSTDAGRLEPPLSQGPCSHIPDLLLKEGPLLLKRTSAPPGSRQPLPPALGAKPAPAKPGGQSPPSPPQGRLGTFTPGFCSYEAEGTFPSHLLRIPRVDLLGPAHLSLYWKLSNCPRHLEQGKCQPAVHLCMVLHCSDQCFSFCLSLFYQLKWV